MGDIGDAYPDTDPKYKDCDSSVFVVETLKRLSETGYRVANIDCTIFAEEPKLGPIKTKMREHLAALPRRAPCCGCA